MKHPAVARMATNFNLAELPSNFPVTVDCVNDEHPGDPIARRLRDLGFVAGEPIQIVARAPFGGDPLVVQIGSTRLALRRAEASRVVIAQ
jgi:ferrous iron transport protein A